MTKRRHLLCSLLSLMWFGSPSSAVAQSDDIEQRYKAALEERDAGNFATACPKLADIVQERAGTSGDPSKGLGARLELAVCNEGWGRLATAAEQYAIVERLASAAGQKERAGKARERRARLLPRVAHLKIRVPSNVAQLTGVSLSLDGKQLGRELWNTRLPVNSGRHTVIVEATGRVPWKGLTSVIADGTSVSVIVKEPRVDGLHAAQDETLETTVDLTAEAPKNAEEGSHTWQRPLAYAMVGLGVVGLGVGVGLAADAADKLARAKPSCPQGAGDPKYRCYAAGFALWNSGHHSADWSTAAVIAGSALVTAGVVLWVTAPSSKVGDMSASVNVAPAGDGCIATVQGTW